MKRRVAAIVLAFLFLFGGGYSAFASKKETSHKHTKHVTKKKTTHKKASHKKSSHKKSSATKSHKGPTGIYYVKPAEENLRSAPSGKREGALVQGTQVHVDEVKGNWARVTIKAWIWRPSLSKTKPKISSALLIEDVAGVFKKDRFVIKGTLNNQTKVPFVKVVLQGELFKGKKRVAHKTVTLFTRKRPLHAGKSYPFTISFKRTKGFDSYGVHIISASEK